MRKIILLLLVAIVISACSEQEEQIENEELSLEDVKVPEEIFTMEKQNENIGEEELKASIKVYLDSFEDLLSASEPFLDMIDEEDELTTEESEKITRIYSLMKSNDENFANYIGNNTLPEDYQEDTERISQFITAVNDLLLEMDDIGKTASEGHITKVNMKSMFGNIGAASGKEQKKIEDFLDQQNIQTKAFGREN